MSVEVIVKNLSVIFGSNKSKKVALGLIDQGYDANKIKKLTKATVANKNLNLTIKPKELFVIVGLSGSGKSTFIRTINRLNKPTIGEIIVDGEDILKMNKVELREYRRTKVSMIFQNFNT